MTNKPLLTIYKASAGSGKTFTLAAEYISLLLQKPDDFRHILAVTFTNKATGEMKERILSQLYGIGQGLPESDGYLDKVKELLKAANITTDVNHNRLTDDQLRENARKALTYILHNYSFFRIETIDSFMVGILRNLAKELELGNDMTIELDEKKVINDSIHDLIKDLDTHSPELSWIVDYISNSIDNEHHWNITTDLADFARNLHKEGWQNHAKTISELTEKDKDVFKRLRASMEEQAAIAKNKIKPYVDRFFEIIGDANLTIDDFAYGKGGVCGYFVKLQKEVYDEPGARITEAMDNAQKWASKNGTRRTEIVALADSQLMALLRDTEAVRKAEAPTINTARLVTRNLYQLQLLGSIDRKMHDNCRRDNRFLLADTCILLKQMASDPSETSFIYEKTGTEINHILIDEFQDTSGMQWANFLPLLIESTSHGHHDLIVGDVKQAIYRWRDSNANIMGHQVEEELKNISPKTETLGTNYRSQARIIQFNNAFFRQLISHIEQQTSEIDPADIVRFYSDVEQQSSHDDDKGCVRIITTTKDKDSKDSEETTADAICRHTVDQIVELLQAGLQQSDIAILTRDHKGIATLASWIAAHPEATGGHELRLVSNEAFTLDTSDVIVLLIEALRWISNASDVVSLAALGIGYHRLVLHDGLTIPAIMQLKDQGYGLPATLIESHDQLAAMPLCELVHTLYDCLCLRSLTGCDVWLQTFFDTVQRYAADENGTLGEFLQEWDERLSGKAIPSGDVEGIRAMTIHKSKGLEFHTVIIPFCDWDFEKSNMPATLWVPADPQLFEGMPCLPIVREKAMKDSLFAAEYREETRQLWMDNLNLLYVAFTRPTSNLIIIRQSKKPSKGPVNVNNVSAFIDMGLGASERYDEEPCTEHPSAKASTNKLLAAATPVASRFYSSPLSMEFRQSNSSRTFVSRGDDSPLSEFIEEGNLLHDIFSHIATASDVTASVQRLYTEGVIDAARRDELEHFVRQALQQPAAADWFSGRYELFNECTILTTHDGVVTQNRPDRVMRMADRTIVVDFKFGKPQQKHIDQVRRYIDLLRQMSFPRVEGYLWYVKEAQTVKI